MHLKVLNIIRRSGPSVHVNYNKKKAQIERIRATHWRW